MASILPTSRTEDVLAEVGSRLKRLRLERNVRIRDLAEDSGVSARTISRLEAGESVGFEQIVRVLRALGRLQALEAFLPPPPISPLQVEKLRGRRRRRASGRSEEDRTPPGARDG